MRIILAILLFILHLHAQEDVEGLAQKISIEDEKIEKNGFWVKRFFDHQDFVKIKDEIQNLQAQHEKLKRKRTKKAKKEKKELEVQLSTLKSKLTLLGEFGKNPYEALIKVDDIVDPPSITNPLSIIGAFSYIADINKNKLEYKKRLSSLNETITSLDEKKELLSRQIDALKDLNTSSKDVEIIEKSFKETQTIIASLTSVYDIYKTTVLVYEKKTAQIEAVLKAKITSETIKGIKILVFIAVLLVFAFLIKMLVKKTIEDSNRTFNIYRAINIISFFIIVFVLTFNYINNLTYFITVLGFVSAGIAIAMKDWFMNLLGWFVIVLGGFVHVGDRIKITKDGFECVGDVLEISLTRITVLEDITLTSYNVNRRTGRVVMIPNNLIFNSLFINYTFSGLKTVWDGIDIMITFDSNHKKAAHIARDIVKKYSKGYTDITRKQVNELRGRYHIRNFNSEPRVYTFIEPYGIKVSSWYLTNSYATLTLRSNISVEIVEAYNEADDIQIAYPSQSIMLSQTPPKPISDLKGTS